MWILAGIAFLAILLILFILVRMILYELAGRPDL